MVLLMVSLQVANQTKIGKAAAIENRRDCDSLFQGVTTIGKELKIVVKI